MNAKVKPNLSSEIQEAFATPKIMHLVQRTLEEDFKTFEVPSPSELAEITVRSLIEAKDQYTVATARLALEVYPTWKQTNVRELYHAYNWRVERAGSAKVAAPHIRGNSLVDLGGGPGTFALEVLKLKPEQNLKVTIADISDWRNTQAKANSSISYRALTIGGKLPFQNDEFDSGSLLYVLHHVETDHDEFLRECARCIRDTLILFEDVRIDQSLGIPKGEQRPARALEKDFTALDLKEQNLFIAAVDYICNHIASQALDMPVPGKYFEFRELETKLQKLFPKASVEKHYHGIYDQKCYPNPEAMYVVRFNKGGK